MALQELAARPSRMTALRRGFARRCPCCGEAPLFRAYLKLIERCPRCGESYAAIRADDIPAYFTILVVGHLVVPILLVLVREDAPNWLTLLVVAPLTLALTFYLLPHIKGCIAALLWSLGIDPDQR